MRRRQCTAGSPPEVKGLRKRELFMATGDNKRGTKTTMKASDLFVKCLEEEGVKYVFGIPGEETLDLLESIRTSASKIKFILTRHEQAAAFMAATYGRLTGKAGVVLSTLGPGATNLVTGVAYAQLGGMPLVAITGQKPVKKSKQGRFQIINVVQMMTRLTKMTTGVASGHKIPSLVREAFKRAEEERPGATHLELPEDIAGEMVDAGPGTGAAPLKRVVHHRPGPDDDAVKEAARMIEAAERPLILIAAGAGRSHPDHHHGGRGDDAHDSPEAPPEASGELKRFIEKTSIPFFTTQMGKGVVDERSPCCLGTAALTEGDYLHCAIDRSDLIISVGHDVTEKPPAVMGFGERKVIHINFYSAFVDDVYFPTHEVVGDIAHTMRALTDEVTVSDKWNFSYFKKMIAEHGKHTREGADDSSFPMKPQRILADLRTAMPPDGVLSLDTGMYKIWIARNYPAYEQNTVLVDNALATMGAGLPVAIAAKLVLPDKKVVAVVGDGGFMMNSLEREPAVRLGVDLTVVFIHDSAYGMIKWKQESAKMPEFGLDYKNPDFVKYAESYGAVGHRVSSADEFKGIFEKCLASPGVHLIDCPVDYSDNVKLFTEELQKKTCLVDDGE